MTLRSRLGLRCWSDVVAVVAAAVTLALPWGARAQEAGGVFDPDPARASQVASLPTPEAPWPPPPGLPAAPAPGESELPDRADLSPVDGAPTDDLRGPEPPDRPQVIVPRPPPPTYPVVINGHVEALIDYFSARERERFRMWISRSGRYLDMIQRVFREQGLPEELAYTAMIESGFSPRAVSRVGAKGMWQFMEATARRYGLVVTRWVDERLDPVKSTVAAARYLGDLHGMFGHWFLAQAAYNAGEARVARAIQRARTSDFWALTQTRHLPDETKMFVPQIVAATVISRNPTRYGFEEIALEPPLAFDEVIVRRALDFDTIAALAGVGVDEVRDLNTALLARVTPPFGSYALRLPPGAGARFEAALRDAPAARLPLWGFHRLARNQSLAEVARLYRTTPQRLAEVNHLPGGRLRGVTELLVPVVGRTGEAISPESAPGRREPGRPAGPGLAGLRDGGREITVQRGDTLWSLAARHGTRPQTLARLNGLEPGDPLLAGTRLKLPTP